MADTNFVDSPESLETPAEAGKFRVDPRQLQSEVEHVLLSLSDSPHRTARGYWLRAGHRRFQVLYDPARLLAIVNDIVNVGPVPTSTSVYVYKPYRFCASKPIAEQLASFRGWLRSTTGLGGI